jgi:hypothetical protein
MHNVHRPRDTEVPDPFCLPELGQDLIATVPFLRSCDEQLFIYYTFWRMS